MFTRLIRSFFGSPPKGVFQTRQWGHPDRASMPGREYRGSPLTLRPTPPIISRKQAQHYHQTNAYAAAGERAITSHMVGYGVTANSQHPDRAVRRALKSVFGRFARHAGIDGENWTAILELTVRTMLVDGEVFIRFVETDGGLALQVIPADLVDEGKTLRLERGWIEAGIEHDADGRVVAYHVFRQRPGDPFATSTETVRIPADEIIHLFRRLYPGQVRGQSWFTPVIRRLIDLDKTQEGINVGLQVAAMHAGFLIDQNGTGGIPYDGLQSGTTLESGLEPGTLKILPSGYDIRFSSPQQAPHAVQMVEQEILAIAAGLGVPAHLVSGDVSKANYSSLRADMNAFRARLEAWQWGLIIPQLCQPVYERVITHAVLSGTIDLPGFWTDPEPYFECEWFPPRLPAVDPQKDAAAMRELLETGLMSRRQAVAELGFNIEDLDAEIAADREREASLGLSFGKSQKPAKESADGNT